MKRTRSILLVCAVAVCLSLPAGAITYIVPDDATLIRKADAIVIGTVIENGVEEEGDRPARTRSIIEIEEVLKGGLEEGGLVTLYHPGGLSPSGKLTRLIPGMPQYLPGQRVLVLLRENGPGAWITLEYGLGRFEFVPDVSGQLLLLRDAENICGWDTQYRPHVEPTRLAGPFVEFVRDVARGNTSDRTYTINPDSVCAAQRSSHEAITPNAAVSAYLFCGCRWNSFPTQTGFRTSGSQTGIPDSSGAASAGASVWTNDPNSNVNYAIIGTSTVTCTNINSQNPCRTGFNDGENTILFNDPSNEITGSFTGSGTLAIGGPWFGGSHNFGGESHGTIVEGDVVVQNGVSTSTGISQTLFEATLAHELGHTLGIRHSNEGQPFASFALMASSLNNGPGSATLADWDQEAVATIYGSGPVCTAVQITTHPQSQTIGSGNSVTLSVAASGTSPFTYEWYRGNSGNTSDPICAGSTTSCTTPVLTQNTNFWVRVRNCSGTNSADSNTAVITVTCTVPQITSGPTANPSTVNFNNASNLSVSATGAAPLTFQWFRGNSGDTSNPLCGNSTSCNTGALTATTNFWVRVTNSCPSGTTNSNTVTVTVNCTPSITSPPSGGSVPRGSTATLNVAASGQTPITFTWFETTSGPPVQVATGSSFTTPAINDSRTYFVRASNACGSVDSNTVTLTPCDPPVITGEPADQQITSGQSANLSVGAEGTGITFQWFRLVNGQPQGVPGATQATFNTGTLTSTQTYFVRVTNTCSAGGNFVSVESRRATVTVMANCIPAQITVQPTANPSTITSGQSSTLSVGATGTSLLYQWFRGNRGDTSQPLTGGTNSVVNTGALTQTTTFWVRISNSCGGNVDSNNVVVTVQANCTLPLITRQPQSTEVKPGGTVRITVTATGNPAPTFQWFRGNPGDMSQPIAGQTAATLTLSNITQTTSVWVRVTNTCGPVNSNGATISLRKRGVRR